MDLLRHRHPRDVEETEKEQLDGIGLGLELTSHD